MNRFESKNKTIYWSPTHYLVTNTVYILTPPELLSHEADHAKRYSEDPNGTSSDLEKEDSDYGNKEDRRVITGSEADVAKRLGRLSPDQQTRYDHFGIYYDESIVKEFDDDI